ncbi:VOC family protein [Desulfovibrio inopinatus]|uniref:VOC family protein n=1 Tax=Desulfovibrio inopinatus TaxID=102109 RepID=UPI000401CECE|nr:VOC family protein [Desulfovibrio inopinatus]
MTMTLHFHHVAISVKDMNKALHFYRDLLGFEILWEANRRSGAPLSNVVGLNNAETHIVMLRGHGAQVELFHYIHPEGQPAYIVNQCDFGLTHFALSVQGIHEFHAQLVKQGVEFNCDPQNLRPGVWATYMKDFEGNTIELVQYDDIQNN